eukprot:TRINITY_DN506_c0_g1_i1.p1 TRINITY_DN506_c0_g1~~TRINITY_DN506_c0_g1_i1.p1  ORF type:complete len:542 (+),score=131.39 TRINITY_DN506_c0_g1_i1:53-1678(+)
MKSLFLAAALVGLSAGAPFTPAEVQVCTTNENCQKYGDAGATCCDTAAVGATCTANTCGCTTTGATPYGFFTAAHGNTLRTCMKVSDSTALKSSHDVVAVLTLTYNTGDCTQIGTFKTEYIQTVQGYFQSSTIKVDAIEHSCTATNNVYTAMKLSMKSSDLLSTLLLSFPDSAITLLTTTNLRLLGTTINQQNLMEVDAVESFCALPTTGITTLRSWFGGTTCKDLTCSTGYIVSDGQCIADTGSTFSASDVHVCSSHSDCRVFGDPYAACVVPTQASATASCVCSTGYSHYVNGAASFKNCFLTATSNLIKGVQPIDVMISMTFNTANCVGIDEFGASFLDEMEQIVDTEPTMAVKLVKHHCSTTRDVTSQTHIGVDTSIMMRMQVEDLFVGAFTQFPGTVLTRLANLATLDARFGRSFSYKAAYYIPSISRFCPDMKETKLRSHFGSNSVTVGGVASATPVCKDLLCNAPYESNINGVCSLPVVTYVDDGDDEISDGAIAGIVVACFVVLVIVIAVVIYKCCFASDEEEQDHTELKEDA